MRFALVLITSFVLATTVIAQQPVDDYATLQRVYIEDPEAAVEALAALPDRTIDRGVDTCARKCLPTQKRAAAMVHTELALDFVYRQPGRAQFHVGKARTLLDATSDRPDFFERWFEFVTMAYLSEGLLVQAGYVAGDGVAKFPNSGRVHAARAMVQELQVTINSPDLRAFILDRKLLPASVRRVLEGVANDYRRALAMDSTLVTARLRLGWALLLINDTRAGQEFTAVVRDTTDNTVRYLAHLFLGTVAESGRRMTDALASYEAARQAGPGFQTGCVAASHAENALGNVERAKALALGCLTLLKSSDPWWRFRFGAYDTAMLAWLRREGQRP